MRRGGRAAKRSHLPHDGVWNKLITANLCKMFKPQLKIHLNEMLPNGGECKHRTRTELRVAGVQPTISPFPPLCLAPPARQLNVASDACEFNYKTAPPLTRCHNKDGAENETNEGLVEGGEGCRSAGLLVNNMLMGMALMKRFLPKRRGGRNLLILCSAQTTTGRTTVMRGEGEVPVSVCHTVPVRFAYSFFALRHKNQGTKLHCARRHCFGCRSKKQMPKGSKQPQVASDTPGIGTWPRPHV